MIIVIGRAELDPARLADVRPALTEMMRHTFEESGCLSYSLAIEHDGADGRPAVLSLAERWVDEAAIREHAASPHMAAFNKAVAGAFYSFDARMFDASNERPLKLK
ncbi:putative quinol monooxygenase [Sandaracinobacteroides hominis]|uniref:putative quinol monooxygenase n=1 Tax=Sandaracinobacteroides hominis TaxID=2780086 RepID=UPI0018F4DB79|nr:putative quinol monooxygenase [Sandaracinobacteroides hominis]